jgi:signal recognition particle receptor subunit beta
MTQTPIGGAPTPTLRLDPVFMRQRVEAIVDDLDELSQRSEVGAVLGEQLRKNVREQIASVRTRLAAEFTILVVGDFKRGKSTLVNALLGEAVVSTGITPETITMTELRAGPELKVEACLANGMVADLRLQDLARERLEPMLAQLPAAVTRLRVAVPNEQLRGVCLVDTPGTGDLVRRFDPLVRDYISHADLVIYLVMALAPLSASEQAFLRASVVPADFPKVMFVVNMLDLVGDEHEIDRLLNHVRGRVQASLPSAQLFGLSARDEFARLTGADRQYPALAAVLEGGFRELREQLDMTLLMDRELVQLDRAMDLLGRSLERWAGGVDGLLASLAEDHAHLASAVAEAQGHQSAANERLAQAIDNLHTEMARMSTEALGWFTSRRLRRSFTLDRWCSGIWPPRRHPGRWTKAPWGERWARRLLAYRCIQPPRAS